MRKLLRYPARPVWPLTTLPVYRWPLPASGIKIKRRRGAPLLTRITVEMTPLWFIWLTRKLVVSRKQVVTLPGDPFPKNLGSVATSALIN